MSGKDGRILLSSGGSLKHSFGVLSFLSLFLFFFLFFLDVVLWFFVFLAVFFELDGRALVNREVLPSLPSDLLVVSSEDFNVLDSDQWRKKQLKKS